MKALIAASFVALAIVATAGGARTAPAPTIEQVLASGSNANGWGIQNVDEITLNGIRSSNGNPATAVTLRQGVQVQATNGDQGGDGGDVTLKAGYGDNGNTAATYLTVEGGRANGPGYLKIETGEGLGNPGDCLINIGGGRAAWRPCP